jgi:tetratricopeptide (TPR) repeat protein
MADLLERKGRPDEGARYSSRLLAQVPNSFTGQMSMAEAWLAASDFERAAQWIQIALKGRDDSDEAKEMDVQRLLAEQKYQQALDRLEEINLTDENAAGIAVRRLAACLGSQQAECANQQINNFRARLQEELSRGGAPPDFIFYVELGQLLTNELSVPGFDVRAAAANLMEFELMNGSRFFGPIYYSRAGLLARNGDMASALETLDAALPAGEPGVFNIDLFSMDVEHSLLLNPLRDLPEFIDWQQRYRERRASMLERMIQMESRGEIMAPAVAMRNLES